MESLKNIYSSLWAAVLLILPLTCLAHFNHEKWDRLLKDHVISIKDGQVTQVDYDGFLKNKRILDNYLADLSAVGRADFDSWEKSEQLAFLINTYNAWTIQVVLERYPELESIREIGLFPFSVWRRRVVELFGDRYSLDDVEHEMIRGSGLFEEPRIHFALNCAAVGCPALRPEAYVGSRLYEQLEDNTKLFLTDKSRNYFADEALFVSRIFDWYREDFEKGWLGVDSVCQFLNVYREQLGINLDSNFCFHTDDIILNYLNYDWSLNRVTLD